MTPARRHPFAPLHPHPELQGTPGHRECGDAFLFGNDCDIVEHQQFDDASRGQLFLRTAFVCATDTDTGRLTAAFRAVADQFSMTYRITGDHPERLLVMVSKMGHCLNDLIFRWRGGDLALSPSCPTTRSSPDGRERRPSLPPRTGHCR